MGQKELKRWHLMEMVEVGKIILREAGERIGVSYRQAKRIGRAIRERGMKGLVHGNRGRPSNNRLKEFLREKVLALRVRERYLKTGLGRITRKESQVGTTLLYLVPLRLLLTTDPGATERRGWRSEGVVKIQISRT